MVSNERTTTSDNALIRTCEMQLPAACCPQLYVRLPLYSSFVAFFQYRLSVVGMLELDSGCTPPKWKRPEDVMKMHRIKMKKRALQSRFVKSMDSTATTAAGPAIGRTTVHKSPSKNPFRWALRRDAYLSHYPTNFRRVPVRRKTPVKNRQADARETLKRARVEYGDDNACSSNLSKVLRDCEQRSVPSVSNVSQYRSLDESVISFADVLRTSKPSTVIEDVWPIHYYFRHLHACGTDCL